MKVRAQHVAAIFAVLLLAGMLLHVDIGTKGLSNPALADEGGVSDEQDVRPLVAGLPGFREGVKPFLDAQVSEHVVKVFAGRVIADPIEIDLFFSQTYRPNSQANACLNPGVSNCLFYYASRAQWAGTEVEACLFIGSSPSANT
jgi:hypothetical protein